MQNTYAQKQKTAQKKDAPTAAAVLDASSQSEGLQRKADMANNAAQREEIPRPNNTGMPDNLKSGIESLSGFSMDDVRVHYNSSKPATVQALAYTQGTDIHVAPGQEKHLPHEAWHVVQQMAGRVSPTTNINGMPVNDNAGLEHEADVMGERAKGQSFSLQLKKSNIGRTNTSKNVSQFAIGTNLQFGVLNVVGENHDESEIRRIHERTLASDMFGPKKYWKEYEFANMQNQYGDNPALRFIHAFYDLKAIKAEIFRRDFDYLKADEKALIYSSIIRFCSDMKNELGRAQSKKGVFDFAISQDTKIQTLVKNIDEIANSVITIRQDPQYKTSNQEDLITLQFRWEYGMDALEKFLNHPGNSNSVSFERSVGMHLTAEDAMNKGKYGIWKIGDEHVSDIIKISTKYPINIPYNLLKKDDFDKYFWQIAKQPKNRQQRKEIIGKKTPKQQQTSQE